MINIGEATKWIAIASIMGSMWGGIAYVKTWHQEQLDKAVVTTQLEMVRQQNEIVNKTEEKLKKESTVILGAFQKALEIERNNSRQLVKKLTIEHDLDRILQQKPGLILPRVNAGTAEYYEQLELITQ